jgi:hypothetical protein
MPDLTQGEKMYITKLNSKYGFVTKTENRKLDDLDGALVEISSRIQSRDNNLMYRVNFISHSWIEDKPKHIHGENLYLIKENYAKQLEQKLFKIKERS